MLARARAVDALGRSEDEDHAVAGESVLVRSDREDEGGRKREDIGRVWTLCWDFRVVKSAAD